LTINVGVNVCGLGVIGNTVVVVGFYGEVAKAIAWDLPTEGYVPMLGWVLKIALGQ
jgi:hypothetical protein